MIDHVTCARNAEPPRRPERGEREADADIAYMRQVIPGEVALRPVTVLFQQHNEARDLPKRTGNCRYAVGLPLLERAMAGARD